MKPNTAYKDGYGSVFITGNVDRDEPSGTCFAELRDWCWAPNSASYRNCGFNTKEFPHTAVVTLVELSESEYVDAYKANFLSYHSKLDFSTNDAFPINYNSRSTNTITFLTVIYDLLKQRKS